MSARPGAVTIRPRRDQRPVAGRAGHGKVVARLKGGDPYIFGRGGEEALFLARAGIPFEVVPGVTAGFCRRRLCRHSPDAPGFHHQPRADHRSRGPGQKVSSLDWEKLATGLGTLVFYMGMANLPLIAGQLMAHGRSPQTPVALVRWATMARQQTLTATLDIVERVRAAGFRPPAIIIVGEVVRLREDLRWYDNRPLSGRTVVVTRAADQAGDFSALLEAKGRGYSNVPQSVCCHRPNGGHRCRHR